MRPFQTIDPQRTPSFISAELEPAAITDDFDLLTSGVIDSLGIVELIGTIEQQLGIAIDLSELDPENLTTLGPLSRYTSTTR